MEAIVIYTQLKHSFDSAKTAALLALKLLPQGTKRRKQFDIVPDTLDYSLKKLFP